MFNVCNEVIENFSLDWSKCVTYSSDNTNSMARRKNSLLKKIKDSQAEQKVFDVGCPCHLAHICAGKGARQFSVYIEDFVIDTFCHFQQSEKRKSQLKVIKHVCTRWLSLGKCIERTLKQWESLESYFLSYFDLQVDPTEEVLDEQPNRAKRLVKTFKDPVTKLYAMFVQLVIPIFDSFIHFYSQKNL